MSVIAAPAIIGVSDHAGWAILVTVAADGSFLDRRRVSLLEDGLPPMPHHHDAQGLPIAEAEALIERVRLSAERNAKLALDAIAEEVPAPVVGVALRACQPLPATLAERLTDYRSQNVADWVMYRRAIAAAAEARGWKVHWYDPKKVQGVALKRPAGPPWNQDHRLAMAAAVAVATG